jgi:hypothetical protein
MVRPILLAGLVAILPSVVQAQGRGMMQPAAHSISAAPRAVTRAPQPVGAPIARGARVVGRNGTARLRTTAPAGRITQRPIFGRRRFDDRGIRPGCSTAPGLGFDEVHLAATCGPGAVGGRGLGTQFPFFFPFFDGGFFLSGSPAVDEAAAPEAQPSEDTENDVPQRNRRVRVSQPAELATERATEAASATPGETDEYVFVRRDGTVFFAVAYAWENGALRYVTSEGLRRSVAREALDLDATQQFNEQRGLNFRLPA